MNLYVTVNIGVSLLISQVHYVTAMLGNKCSVLFVYDFFIVFYGSWFDHVLSWWRHKDDENVLFLKYEEMKKVRVTRPMNCFQVRL